MLTPNCAEYTNNDGVVAVRLLGRTAGNGTLGSMADSSPLLQDRVRTDTFGLGEIMFGQSDDCRPSVMFVNRSYWPDAEATGQLLTELCEDLASDFEVSVVCGQPNSNPSGESFLRSGTEVHNGVTIHRVRHSQFPKASSLGRVTNLASFAVAAAIRTARMPAPDLIVTESDPFFLPLLGARAKRKRGMAFIAYLQDIYPDVAIALGKIKEGRVTRYLRSALSRAYQTADRVAVLSGDMCHTLARFGVSPERVKTIPNWVDTDKIFPRADRESPFRAEHGMTDRFVVMHSGNMGLSQRLDSLLDVGQLLSDDPDFQLYLVGGGAKCDQLKSNRNSRGLDNVHFLDYQPKERLQESLASADVHVISTSEGALNCLMPSKLYGILASGTPVLAMVPLDSELAALVRTNEVGIAVAPDEPDEAAMRLRDLKAHPKRLEQLGINARKLAEAHYDRHRCTGDFKTLIHETLSADEDLEQASVSHPCESTY